MSEVTDTFYKEYDAIFELLERIYKMKRQWYEEQKKILERNCSAEQALQSIKSIKQVLVIEAYQQGCSNDYIKSELNKLKPNPNKPAFKIMPEALEAIREDNCATCGQPIKKFKDEESQKEYQISGMCQRCQDVTFGKGRDW